jgi:NAD(P)H-flavin reductase
MVSKFKPLLEWIALIALAGALGLGLTLLPVEKSSIQLGLLVAGGLGLAYLLYLVSQLSKCSDDDDFDMGNWPADPDDQSDVKFEVKP